MVVVLFIFLLSIHVQSTLIFLLYYTIENNFNKTLVFIMFLNCYDQFRVLAWCLYDHPTGDRSWWVTDAFSIISSWQRCHHRGALMDRGPHLLILQWRCTSGCTCVLWVVAHGGGWRALREDWEVFVPRIGRLQPEIGEGRAARRVNDPYCKREAPIPVSVTSIQEALWC